MTTHRVLKSVLNNFLGTYISRYSDYQGYWLHGQLLIDLREWTMDLLSVPLKEDTIKDVAHRLAIRRFAEQLNLSGLTFDAIREATLRLIRDPEIIDGFHGYYTSPGHIVSFIVKVVMSNGRVYEKKERIFVAPHDPDKESRRYEADWGT